MGSDCVEKTWGRMSTCVKRLRVVDLYDGITILSNISNPIVLAALGHMSLQFQHTDEVTWIEDVDHVDAVDPDLRGTSVPDDAAIAKLWHDGQDLARARALDDGMKLFANQHHPTCKTPWILD